MPGGELVARDFAHLIDLLFAGSWNAELRRYRASAAYRGVSRAGQPLQSSLAHLGGNFVEKERHVLRNFRKYARRTFVGDDSIWNWLSLAQHHGLPTRLLDWTYSPYVALHFTTDLLEHFDVDAELWVVNFAETNRRLPKALRSVLEHEGSDVFTGEMLSSVAPTLEALDELASEAFVLFIEPPSLDDRIVNQSALFSVMSKPHAVMADWLDEHPEAYRRIVIPAELKWEVRDKLDQANISERVLFPGLDGLSRWLKRYYTERPES
jgi:hypothetical protein